MLCIPELFHPRLEAPLTWNFPYPKLSPPATNENEMSKKNTFTLKLKKSWCTVVFLFTELGECNKKKKVYLPYWILNSLKLNTLKSSELSCLKKCQLNRKYVSMSFTSGKIIFFYKKLEFHYQKRRYKRVEMRSPHLAKGIIRKLPNWQKFEQRSDYKIH